MQETLAAALAMLTWACEDPGFESRVTLSGYRVIGIEADPPEAAPDDIVTLRVHDYQDNGEAVDYRFSLCLVDPGPDARYRCPDAALQLEVGDGPEVTLDLGPGALDLQTRLREAGDAASNTDGSAPSVEAGFDMLLSLDSGQDCDGCRRVQSVKRLRIRDADLSERNHNPVVLTFEAPAETAPGVDLPLSVEVEPPEAFQDEQGETHTEQYLFTWYSSLGEAAPALTYADEQRTELPIPDDAEPGSPITVAVAVRDGRGGLTVARRQVMIR
ncbi:MAG: hypothetical protein OEZ06_05025 [Myxococcales bacterium]|nr:hypothetical protein [Myxococcales bacterium]